MISKKNRAYEKHKRIKYRRKYIEARKNKDQKKLKINGKGKIYK